MPRFTYRRLTDKEFTLELARRNMTPGAFARIFGVNLNTANRWASGELDIPPWVPIALTLLSLEGGLGTARMAAAAFIAADNAYPERGDFPYLRERELPADVEQGD